MKSLTVVLFCDGRIVPANDGFSGHLAGRIQIHAALGTRPSLIVTDRGWNDPLKLEQLPVPVDLVSPEQYYEGAPEIKALLDARRPDVVVIPNSHIVLTAVRSRIAQCRIIFEVHELVSDLAAQLGEDGRTGPERTLELAAAQCADLVVTFTEHDRLRFLNAGLDPDRVVARACISSIATPTGFASRDPWRLVFLGNGYYEPNRRAIEFLAAELLPKLPSHAVMSIIGTQPAWPALQRDTRVRLVGAVENLGVALQTSAVGLCPVWHATGIRVKIFDYGAAGLATVAARSGLEGIPATLGVIAVDSKEEFIGAVLRLIASPEECAWRQKAAAATFRANDGTAAEAELLSRVLGRPAVDEKLRRKVAESSEVQNALSLCPQPRWLQETLCSKRFAGGEA